jgi:hypothetical protein
MKLARWLPAAMLWLALGGLASAQMPGYPNPNAAGPYGMGYPGRPAAFADAPMGGEAIGAPGPMAPAPVYSDSLPGQYGPPAAYGGAPGAYPGGPYPGGPAPTDGGNGFCAPDVCYDSGLRQRIGCAYASVDAMYWKPEAGAPSAVATSVSVPTATFLTGQSAMWGHRVVPRLTVGYVFDRGVAVEGTYFYIDNFSSFNAQTATGNINGFVPVGNFSAADSFLSENFRKLQNAEINLIETNHFVNILAGLRWLEFQDNVRMTATKAGAIGSTNISTYNRLIGAQGGVRMGYDWGLLGFQVFGKAGLYFNDASETTQYSNVDPTVNGTRHNGGQTEAFIGDVQAMVTYRPLASWTLRAGYNALWALQVAAANDQVLPPPNSALTGSVLNQRSDLLVHGPFAGAEFRW